VSEFDDSGSHEQTQPAPVQPVPEQPQPPAPVAQPFVPLTEPPAETEAPVATEPPQAPPAQAVQAETEWDQAGADGAPPDPFASWPQAVSGEVIEDAPSEGSEHVRGEVEVPDGYALIEGSPLGEHRSVAVVVSRFNGGVTNRLLARALEALEEAGVAQDSITVVPVPGAFELPLVAMALAKTRRYACIVALGTVVRGETPHFDYVAAECASGLQLAGIETGIPVSFGVLTVNTVAQAEARIGKAAQAVQSALEMADLFARLRATAA
jgi:6,7-dimethyl-8-ribityllumazine synthase